MKKAILFFLTFVLLTSSLNQKSMAEDKKEEAKTVESTETKAAEVKKEPETIADKPIEEPEVINAVWNESLGLKDYYLSANTISVIANNNLKNYKEHLEKEYAAHPDTYSTAIEYGLVSLDLGNVEVADKVFSRAVNDFKGNPTPPVYKAWVDALKGDYKSAKDYWYPNLKVKISMGYDGLFWLSSEVDSVVGLNSIQNYLPENEKEEVKTLIADITKHIGGNPKLASILVSNALQNGQLRSAGTKLANILTKYPDEPINIGLLGVSQLIAGKYDEALKLLDRSNQLFPRSPMINLMRARALFALDKRKDSKLAYSKALELDPTLESKNVKKDYLLQSKSYVSSSVESESTTKQ